jgi:hypothetical protein
MSLNLQLQLQMYRLGFLMLIVLAVYITKFDLLPGDMLHPTLLHAGPPVAAALAAVPKWSVPSQNLIHMLQICSQQQAHQKRPNTDHCCFSG